MVRSIDGEARRRLLADAVWRLMRRGGLEAASVRAVAAEAGLATGSVRHFFASQDELHVFAMRELFRIVTERVQEVLSRGPAEFGPDGGAGGSGEAGEWGPGQARARVVAVLLETQPMTVEQSELFLVSTQFVIKAMLQPALAPVAKETADLLHDTYLQLIGFLVQTGAAPADLDVGRTASDLGVVLDGLALRRLTAPHLLAVEDIRDTVTAFVENLRGDQP
ncbi:TetR/AcrR family transcriptional regulator [Kineosporia rhizophila]|uniref:TetR/AcrR family transcriptional regulator n=1 Tax=Kineosporia rhizophila TaxID=84633 RepID=UPI001E5BF498|nr:TetR/AcrR family transcriptional regulator [Kineosporia rhizophila]